MSVRPRTILLGLLALAMLPGSALAAKGYLSTPDIHGDRIIFSAEGDIWTCADTGGTSRRLTTHIGAERYPRFSPDGKWIAFTGVYDGNRDVFVMPAEGGEPRRLTWHPASDEVIEWTPDGKQVIFRSWRESPHYSWELFMVPAQGGDIVKLPLGWAARLDIDPKSGRWAFNRISRETHTWKRYRGGTASDIWVGDPDKEDYRRVTEFTGTDAYPMWLGKRIYFICDQGGTYNIWSMKPDGGDRKRHTDSGKWDARWPGMGPDGRIVYMLAGGIHLFDPGTGKDRSLDIELPSERMLTRQRYSNPGRNISSFDLSPDGERLAVVTRGEIFSVPVEDGVTLPVTRGSGAREDYATYSPDGKRLLYLTDADREEAFHSADAWGRGASEVVKEAGKSGFHFPPSYSPDGKWVAYAMDDMALYIVPAEGGKPRKVDQSERWLIRDYSWSPDGRWLAYTRIESNDFGRIHIYDTQEKETHAVTGVYTEDNSPAWDPEGRYLYFLSTRTLNPLLGSRDFNNVEIRDEKPYLLLLAADAENPFAKLAGLPPDEEESDEEDESAEDDEDEESDEDEEELTPVEIDFDGLRERVIELPVAMGNYSNLAATASKVFYLSWPVRGWAEGAERHGESPRVDNELMSFDLESEEAEVFLSGVFDYKLARKEDKMAAMTGRGEIHVVAADGPPDLSESLISLDGIVLELDPQEEWEQIYYEAWRRMRDRYWDTNMAGLDWRAMRDKYAKLLPLISSRDDLGDIIGELIGELCTSHTYVWGGDPAVNVPRRAIGQLGADLVRDGDAFRIERIYRGDDADNEHSPLLAPGVNVKEGDYVLAVNGLPFSPDHPFHASLENLADMDVLLTVADDGAGEQNRREVVVRTLDLDIGLRYADWVRCKRKQVSEQTDGKIAYIHVPDMGRRGMIEFNTWFYSQLDKEGMIVDMRWNGGGFISSMLVERLRRPITAFNRSRHGRVDPYPEVQLNGPFVVLTNEFAGSDGDIFPRAVQLEKLAPVIGMRSWGGVVGINIMRLLVDGGIVTYPFSAWWDQEWGWGLENRGVEPDIVVQNMPQELAHGKDTQLERGIAEVLRLHEEQPPARPQFEQEPTKSRKAFRREG